MQRQTYLSFMKSRMYSYLLQSSRLHVPLGRSFYIIALITLNSFCSFNVFTPTQTALLTIISIYNFQILYNSDDIYFYIMMIIKYIPNTIKTLQLLCLYTYNRPFSKSKNQIVNHVTRNCLPNLKRDKSMEIYESQADLQLASSLSKLSLKDFSIKIHKLLIQKQKSAIFWSSVQNQFLQRLVPTTDPVIIRSYSKILYSLSKSKKSTGNYQTKVSLVLPFSTPQSFTTIVAAMSRIAPFSQEFGYIVEMLYYKRKAQFNPREIIAINYSLVNNGRNCDTSIIKHIDSYNAVQTITMLRSYDKSNQMTQQILKTSFLKLRSIQGQFNVLDLSDIIYIYLKYQYLPQEIETMLQQSYKILKRHINDICIQKIWTYLPKNVNKGYLKIKFIEEIITTIEILRKGKNMSEVIWKKLQPTFQQFQNIELKLRLQKIY